MVECGPGNGYGEDTEIGGSVGLPKGRSQRGVCGRVPNESNVSLSRYVNMLVNTCTVVHASVGILYMYMCA
jgi:hypothetical protein